MLQKTFVITLHLCAYNAPGTFLKRKSTSKHENFNKFNMKKHVFNKNFEFKVDLPAAWSTADQAAPPAAHPVNFIF